jgi:hypothetical protein
MKKTVFLFFVLTSFFYSCSKDDVNTADWDSEGDKIYPVYIKLTDTEMKKKTWSVFSSTDSTKVGRGHVALWSFYEEKYAYDLACPIEWDNSTIYKVDTTGDYLRCDKCESVYSSKKGEALKGIAKEKNKNLKRYKITQQFDGSWLITN